MTMSAFTRLAKSTLVLLKKQFPKSFLDDAAVVPLKIGILGDLFAALDKEPAFSRRKLRMAVRYYVHSRHYLKAMVKGAKRIDLQGNPVDEVTENQAQSALKNYQRLYQARPHSEKDGESPHPEQW